jgi:hypothetical protein
MNSLIQRKKATSVFLVAFGLACLGLLPTAHAVVPAPDGGYGPPGYGTGNTAEGQNALLSLTTGSYNTGVGLLSLRSNTTTSLNTAIGAGALLANTANQNTATGAVALFHNTIGSLNTANGAFALFNNTTGTGNTAIGADALINNTTGPENTALGAGAGANVITATNVICIGNPGADVTHTTWIGNVYGVTTQNGSTAPVIVSADGQLGTNASSERFKKDIASMDKASEVILSLRPVSFHYKSDSKGTPQFGLIAEEVAKVNPDLVVRDRNGEIYSVRYEAVNAMLLNEFLKEHHQVQDLKAIVAGQQKQLEALTTGLQKVSAQLAAASPSRGGLETSKPAPQVVNNP